MGLQFKNLETNFLLIRSAFTIVKMRFIKIPLETPKQNLFRDPKIIIEGLIKNTLINKYLKMPYFYINTDNVAKYRPR